MATNAASGPDSIRSGTTPSPSGTGPSKTDAHPCARFGERARREASRIVARVVGEADDPARGPDPDVERPGVIVRPGDGAHEHPMLLEDGRALEGRERVPRRRSAALAVARSRAA